MDAACSPCRICCSVNCSCQPPTPNHDMFLQWDIVKSVVKSVAGLQGRKFKVRARGRLEVHCCPNLAVHQAFDLAAQPAKLPKGHQP